MIKADEPQSVADSFRDGCSVREANWLDRVLTPSQIAKLADDPGAPWARSMHDALIAALRAQIMADGDFTIPGCFIAHDAPDMTALGLLDLADDVQRDADDVCRMMDEISNKARARE